MSAIEQIKDSMTIRQLWAKLNLATEPNDKGPSLCPFHQEKSPSLNIYAAGRKFHCFGCGAGGSVIDFYIHAMRLPEGAKGASEAVRALSAMLNLEMPEYQPLYKPAERAIARLDTTSRAADGLMTTDVSPEYMAWAKERGIYKAVINFMMDEGSLSFIGGVPNYYYNTGTKVRYDIHSSRSSRWMQGSPQGGLWRYKQVTRFGVKMVYIAEGESDTMRLQQQSVHYSEQAVGLPGASTMPTPALAALIGSGRDVFICLDNDPAGRTATQKLTALLHEHAHACRVFHFPWEADDPKDICALHEEILSKKLAHITRIANSTPPQP